MMRRIYSYPAGSVLLALLPFAMGWLTATAIAKPTGPKPSSSPRGSGGRSIPEDGADFGLGSELDAELGLPDPEAMLEGSETEKVAFAVLKKRPWAYLGARVCFQGAVLSIREEFEATYIQVVVRTAGRLDATHQVMIEHLASTRFLPGDEIRFCGSVMGPVEVPTQANWRIEAIEILTEEVSKARPPASKRHSEKWTPRPPSHPPACQSPKGHEKPSAP